MTTGDLSSSRGRRSSHNPSSQRKQVIVAVEADDDSRHMRIDQGLLDASNEAKNQVLVQQQNNNKSSAWWPSVLSATPSTTTNTNTQLPSQVAQTNISLSNPGIPLASQSKHRRTVSKTYRVP